MNNYKIKVNGPDNSAEIQDLFFELGYVWVCSKKDITNLDATYIYAKDGVLTAGFNDLNFAEAGHQELTLPQLRDLVAQSKNEQGLISGADALRALADGKEVECKNKVSLDWFSCLSLSVAELVDGSCNYRIKPRTIKLELEIPEPFEPRERERYWFIDSCSECGYSSAIYHDVLEDAQLMQYGAYQSEQDVIAVRDALRGIKG
ncbi:hypothetical protein F3J02_01410 [Acinetobacter sp. Tr-809]|uniref:hypothetical protein n=1 Tax=Acinetobacter sp. Tr-809 TaxID=2608324 RepID=UPI001423BBE0|nr:hypothetical protein [Acinetobacter sp. Tr-809]NIE95152.1 hypothetical protein [Acinetobacter sp. Tr-809]